MYYKYLISHNVKKIIRNELIIPNKKISVNNSFSEIDLNAQQINLLYMQLEGFFKIEIIDHELEGDITLKDLRNYIIKKLDTHH
jgi:acyl carrier protein